MMVGNQQSHLDPLASPYQPSTQSTRLRACAFPLAQTNGERRAAHGTEEAGTKASGKQFIGL